MRYSAARGGRENLDKVQRILETSLADPKKASDHDRRLLAKLFESVGNVEGAEQQYLVLYHPVGTSTRPTGLPISSCC